MSKDQLKALAEFGKAVEFAPGEAIVKQGAVSDSLFLVLEGEAGVYATDQHGGQIHLRTIKTGGHFGEIGFLKAGKRAAHVKALTRCTLFELDENSLRELLKKPDLAVSFLHGLSRSLAGRLAEMTTRFADFRSSVKDMWTI